MEMFSPPWTSGPEQHQAAACQGVGHHQVPEAVHVLSAAELPGDDQLLHEIHQGGGQHPQAADSCL